jgi:hypothetical protein
LPEDRNRAGFQKVVLLLKNQTMDEVQKRRLCLKTLDNGQSRKKKIVKKLDAGQSPKKEDFVKKIRQWTKSKKIVLKN